MRWLHANPKVHTDVDRDAVEIARTVAMAVNTYADSKRADLEAALRRVAQHAFNNEAFTEATTVSVDDMLESQCLVFVGKHLGITGAFQATQRFPARL